MSDNKRKCIFCGEGDLTKEHIYSKWMFDILELENKTFKPTIHLIEMSDSNDFSDKFLANVSDGRQISYEEFTLKQVCRTCNNGWMSELEAKVKYIVKQLLNNPSDPETISPEDALILSQWAIFKIMLTSLATQEKIIFSQMAYQLIKKGVIPEGFLVEVGRMNYSSLNFVIGGAVVRKAFDISRDELDLATQNFYKACIQIGTIAFRVSFLRTHIPVFRKQIIKKLTVLYPYHTKMLFNAQPQNQKEYSKGLELIMLNAQLAIHD